MWRDRWSGQRKEKQEGVFLPGQWVYEGESQKRGALELREGDLLLGDEEGGSLVQEFRDAFEPEESPDSDEKKSLREFGERLSKTEGQSWECLLGIPLLLESQESEFEETTLEKAIKEGIGALEAICRQPRTNLYQEEERLLVSRCKRLSPRAPMVLAAQSQDWESRTLWGGVRPKKILGLIREEEIDLYENRMIVKLVERLKRYCLGRLRLLQRALALFQQEIDYQELYKESHYRRQERLSKLWGSAVKEGKERQKSNAEEALKRAEGLFRRFQRLEGSLLFRVLRRRLKESFAFRETNILLHDALYQKAGHLWKVWEAWKREESPSLSEVWRKSQEAAQGYNAFAWTLLLQTLEAFGFEPCERQEDPKIGEGFRLRGAVGSLEVSKTREALRLKGEESGARCRIIALPTHLEATKRGERWIRSVLEDEKKGRVAAGNEQTIFLFLPSSPSVLPKSTQKRISSLGKEGDGEGAMFVKAAPWDLESMERLMRALRWVLWDSLFSKYEPCFKLPKSWEPKERLPQEIRKEGNDFWLERPLRSGKWPEFEQRLAEEREKLKSLEKNIATAKNTGDKKHLNLQKKAQDDFVKDLDFLSSELDATHAILNLLRVCPICGTKGDFQGQKESFGCECGDCKSSWGTEACKLCKSVFSFLHFPKNRMLDAKLLEEEVSEKGTAKIEREKWFGGDVLALPFKGQDRRFLCPRCGGKGVSEIARDEA